MKGFTAFGRVARESPASLGIAFHRFFHLDLHFFVGFVTAKIFRCFNMKVEIIEANTFALTKF